MGWVEVLPSGNVRGVARNAVTGKRWSQTFEGDGAWAEADAWWRREERKADDHYTAAGVDVNRQQRGIPLFAEHVIEWAKSAKSGGTEDYEVGTLLGYRTQARMLAKRWPTQRVDEITERMIRTYLAELRTAGLAPSTRTSRLVALRHSMHAAIQAGYRPDEPTLGIKHPKARDHEARILTEPELMLLLVCLPGWLWPAALLSHDSGLRISEICGLRMRSLDLLRGKVTVADIVDVDGSDRAHPKGKKILDVPLSARCLAALRAHVHDYPPAGRNGYVFTRPSTGRRLRPSAVRDAWDMALELAQLDGDKPTWHDLRHGCATALAELGVDPWVIRDILRHLNIATTQRYVRRANLGRQAAAIDQAFGARNSDDTTAVAGGA